MPQRIRPREQIDRRNAKIRAIRAANRVERIVVEKARRDARLDIVNANKRKWYAENRDKCKAYNRGHYLKYKHRSVAKKAFRKAWVLQATPIWADKSAIDGIYDLARLKTLGTSVRWEVDHIVPLQGHNVCGLHVENNLRVIEMTKNRSKHNRHEAI